MQARRGQQPGKGTQWGGQGGSVWHGDVLGSRELGIHWAPGAVSWPPPRSPTAAGPAPSWPQAFVAPVYFPVNETEGGAPPQLPLATPRCQRHLVQRLQPVPQAAPGHTCQLWPTCTGEGAWCSWSWGWGERKENLMLPLLFASRVSPSKSSKLSECKRSSGVWGPYCSLQSRKVRATGLRSGQTERKQASVLCPDLAASQLSNSGQVT